MTRFLIAAFAVPMSLASFVPAQAHAHGYYACMEIMMMDCQAPLDDDPLSICQAQADAYCSNHQHGGGGFEPLDDPEFTIEDREGIFVVTQTMDLSALSQAQRAYIGTMIRLKLEMRALRLEAQQARMRLDTEMEDDGAAATAN